MSSLMAGVLHVPDVSLLQHISFKRLNYLFSPSPGSREDVSQAVDSSVLNEGASKTCRTLVLED